MCNFAHAKQAQMAESVDALVSNTSGAIHPGSIPGLGTSKSAIEYQHLVDFILYSLFPFCSHTDLFASSLNGIEWA